MDVYDSRFFVINKRLMMSFGLWPYQDATHKFYIRILLSAILTTMMLPQLLCLKKYFGKDVDKLIEHLAIVIYISVIYLKILTSISAESKLREALDIMAKNWQTINDKHERSILIHYSERGRTLTIGYITYVIAALVAFITLPVTPMVLNRINPLNESRPRLFILDGEFVVDSHEHYGKIYLFDALSCIMTACVIITVDTMYAACIEHCVALFNIVNFASILESSYSTSFLFLMGLNMIIFSITSVLILIKLDQVMEFIRFTLVLIGMLVHLFYASWPGQKMIDHSGGLFRDTYTTEWYESSTKAQHLLKFITLRCYKPCQMTAGGIYIMNFANFLSILKTSISYITVFSSFR